MAHAVYYSDEEHQGNFFVSSFYRKRQGKVRFLFLASIAVSYGGWQGLGKGQSLNFYLMFSGSCYCQKELTNERRGSKHLLCSKNIHLRGEIQGMLESALHHFEQHILGSNLKKGRIIHELRQEKKKLEVFLESRVYLYTLFLYEFLDVS